MDKAIKKGFDKVKKVASKEELSLIKKDKALDKKCAMRKDADKKRK